MFCRGIPPTACPSVAYPRQGSKSARLWLLALNGYRNGVIDILIGSVRNIGWRIVERQAICREGVLVFNLHIMGPFLLHKSLPTIAKVV